MSDYLYGRIPNTGEYKHHYSHECAGQCEAHRAAASRRSGGGDSSSSSDGGYGYVIVVVAIVAALVLFGKISGCGKNPSDGAKPPSKASSVNHSSRSSG